MYGCFLIKNLNTNSKELIECVLNENDNILLLKDDKYYINNKKYIESKFSKYILRYKCFKNIANTNNYNLYDVIYFPNININDMSKFFKKQ